MDGKRIGCLQIVSLHVPIKKLWSSVRSSSQRKSASSTTIRPTFSSEDLANYFTDIATDSTYDQALINDKCKKLNSLKRCVRTTVIVIVSQN